MAYCGPHGIPLSVFLSWSDADQDAALAWQAHESRRCRGCGRHPDEGDFHAHVNVCPGCVALESLSSQDDVRKMRGAHVRLAAGSAQECKRCASERAMNTRR